MGLFNKRSAKVYIDSDGPQADAKQSKDPGNMRNPMASRSAINGSNTQFTSLYHTEQILPSGPDPATDPVAYLQSIWSVRERTGLVYQRAKRNQLRHFDVDNSKLGDAADYVVSIIKRDYASDYSRIPQHGRWQHFNAGGRPRLEQLVATWPSTVDNQERTRRLLDLFFVSALLGAGAGSRWTYRSKESGKVYKRSEGLAVASLEMFKAGHFSSDPANPCQVDSKGLRKCTEQSLAKGLQATGSNILPGVSGRAELLNHLGEALFDTKYYGRTARPGNMLDYLLSHPTTQAASVPIISIPTLWDLLSDTLSTVWPSDRTTLDGVPLGDAYPCTSMPPCPPNQQWETIIAFHNSTQWLCYSIMAPMSKVLKVRFSGTELLTGLAEYRNGGLFVDIGLLTLKEVDQRRGIQAFKRHGAAGEERTVEVVPLFEVTDDVIVEWRAATVGYLDELLVEVNSLLGLSGKDKLSLSQMLEAGSWKAGRELAEVSRPNTKEPPIMILSDGTVL